MTDLEGIASYFDWWLQHQERERAREGLQTDDNTMIVKPPKWPDRRQLKAISGAALDGQKRIAELEAAAKSALAQLNSIMDVRMPGHAAGALVHARETLKSVVQ